MKATFEQLCEFVDGIIRALDHRIGIDPDKDLSWDFGRVEGKTCTMTTISFKWVDYYTVEDEEPHFAEDVLYLDGTESPTKIIKDIEDILERIDDTEIETKSRIEVLADAYHD